MEQDRQTIEAILTSHTLIPYAHGEIKIEAVFDRANDRYLLVNVGWDKKGRVHGALVHVDLIDGKFWIQRDGTEGGIASELVQTGIPRQRIVLAFRRPEVRRLTEYAVA
ncbi:MAG TPA: XisI protein [Tepidisphaeraceae bacterium]|nr:XisI protein [Tepidisphaeraceae bacterium]